MMQKEDDGARRDEAVHLRRQIGPVAAASLILGTVVGSGIFIAPKGVLLNSGSVGLSLVVWALCGLLSLFGALCYAELGTTFSKSGGHYTYLLETLGPLPAFLRLWAEFIFIRPAVASYVSLAFGRYVVEPFFAPCEAPTALIRLVSLLGVTFVVGVNCWSVAAAARTQVTLTFIKTFALVLIIVAGVVALTKGKTENFQKGFELEALTPERLPLAFYNGLYAYGGWFSLNMVTEEIINPNRTIPLAVICSMVTVTVLYVLVNVSYYTVMTPGELLASEAVAVVYVCQPRAPGCVARHSPPGGAVLSGRSQRGLLNRAQDAVCGGQRGSVAPHLLHDSHPPAHAASSSLVSVPIGGADAAHRGDPTPHQLGLLCALVLHRLGNAGDVGAPPPLPAAPSAFQGPPGHRHHLHLGVLLHRGLVTVLGPLEHGTQLRVDVDRRSSVLRHRASVPTAAQMETLAQ
ncbi:cystine/glutamate transporter isoform X2 [Syngnathus acus]|uniref:cystine/glutamate transporter isoform X2 n=1 Tax=Syngnathus acus TaxID=161584 RepID=UPI00188628D3|nr:cystine/glutamate transporter isoform X2 [Syngnathus acus]